MEEDKNISDLFFSAKDLNRLILEFFSDEDLLSYLSGINRYAKRLSHQILLERDGKKIHFKTEKWLSVFLEKLRTNSYPKALIPRFNAKKITHRRYLSARAKTALIVYFLRQYEVIYDNTLSFLMLAYNSRELYRAVIPGVLIMPHHSQWEDVIVADESIYRDATEQQLEMMLEQFLGQCQDQDGVIQKSAIYAIGTLSAYLNEPQIRIALNQLFLCCQDYNGSIRLAAQNVICQLSADYPINIFEYEHTDYLFFSRQELQGIQSDLRENVLKQKL